jgi:hypothetical protein
MKVELTNDEERAAWLECLVAAGPLLEDSAKDPSRLAELADRLFEEFRKRSR